MKFPIPQDWDGVTWCRWSICWPASEGWEGFLRGLITLPMRGWTWDERSGSIQDVQIVGREIFTQNLPLNGVIMACNDDLLPDSFNNIALAINNLASRQGSGKCCGTVQNVISSTVQSFIPSAVDGSSLPVWGSLPPVVIPESGVPEGYSTVEEYKLSKCRLAHQTVDGVAATLRGLGAITVFNIITLGGLVLVAIASSIVFPPSAIPALLAAMLLLTGGLAVLVTLGDLITDNREELICALYTSDTVEGMIIGVEAIMTTIVVALPVATALQIVAKGIAMMFFNSDTLNGMMTYTAALGYPDEECDFCNWWSCVFGTILASDATSITLQSIETESFDGLTAIAYPNSQGLVQLSAEHLGGWSPPGQSPEFVSAWDENADLCGAGGGGAWDNVSANLETGPFTARVFQHKGDSTFVVKYTKLPPGGA